MKNINKQIAAHLKSMNDLALPEVERLARKCLSQNPIKIKEFVMCMGTFFFTDQTGEVLYSNIAEKYSGYKPLNDFICEWDGILKLTGEPMRFTATGIKITDW